MEFVSGSPERRRLFFDQSLSLYDPEYLENLRRFKRVLKSRNKALKDQDLGVLSALDSQFILYGSFLMKKRSAAAENFSRLFQPLYEKVTGIEGITVRYMPSWKEEDALKLAGLLEKKRELELAVGTSLSGPQRDRYLFTRNGQDFSYNASTGQRRLISLLLLSAQAQLYQDETGKKPVLLLDDVLLELDGEKRRRFLTAMPDYDQGFYTFLPEEPYDRYLRDDTLVYHVRGGGLER
jgi:DNA replication and repair protein RecF